MRTTLSIDDDLSSTIRHLAARENRSLSDEASALVCKGLAQTSSPTAAVRNGIPLFAMRSSTVDVTLELINQLRDETL